MKRLTLKTLQELPPLARVVLGIADPDENDICRHMAESVSDKEWEAIMTVVEVVDKKMRHSTADEEGFAFLQQQSALVDRLKNESKYADILANPHRLSPREQDGLLNWMKREGLTIDNLF